MVDPNLVAAKLSDLAARAARIRTHRKESADDLGADEDALDLVSFNLMLCVQICADIASHVIADEGWPAAKSIADSFERLASASHAGLSDLDAFAREVSAWVMTQR